MITIGVCLETVFTDRPAPERIARIRQAGFSGVEFWHPEGTWDGSTIRRDWAKDPQQLREAAEQQGVVLTDFALHAWDGSIGGSPVNPADHPKYIDQVRRMLAFAQAAGIRKGITLSGTAAPGLSRTQMREHLEKALLQAVELARQADFLLLLEPLNTLVDHPGYYLDSSREAVQIIRSIGSPHLKMLYDIYHMQIMEGNVLATIEQHLDCIGHFHAAGVPGRGELFTGELHYPNILRRLESLGYEGSFGLEYFPTLPDPQESLRQTYRYVFGG
ncbi:MAG TPA: TIM barrel protein [Thermoguttaceae bacterium]|nr:TIM barrel protein [Thermoguttaceae bacterium]